MHPTWDSWFIIPYISHITYHRGYAISLGLFLGLTIPHLLLVPYLYTWLVILHEIPHKEFPVCALCDCICLLCYVSREDVPLYAYNTIYIYIQMYRDICILYFNLPWKMSLHLILSPKNASTTLSVIETAPECRPLESTAIQSWRDLGYALEVSSQQFR